MHNNQVVKLSYDLSAKGTYPPAIPKLMTEPFMTIAHDGANVFRATISTHAGTHVDAPNHVIADGYKITDFAIEEFVFRRPYCVEIAMRDGELFQPEHFEPFHDGIKDCDLLLVKTGFGPLRNSDPERYIHENPGFSVRTAEYIRRVYPNLKGIGTDTISFAALRHLEEGMEAHRVVFKGEGRRFLIFEDLNLDYDLTRLRQVIALPWLIEDVDSGPCTAIGFIEG